MSGGAELSARLVAGVLELLQHTTPCYADRMVPPAHKAAQHHMIAHATTIAALPSRDPVDTAAMLYAIGVQESGAWCLHVHSGAHGGRGRGLWQVEPGSNAPQLGPRTGVTAEATATSAIAAAWVLQRSWHCGWRPEARITGYAGRACNTEWPTLSQRTRRYWWALARLRAATAER
jgi:hypothetical protein